MARRQTLISEIANDARTARLEPTLMKGAATLEPQGVRFKRERAQMDVVTWSVSELLSRHGMSIALQLTVMLVDQFCGFVLVSLMVTSCWPLSPPPGRALYLQGVWLSDTAQNSRRGGERWTGRGE
ncbi:hypothetical protein DPX16_22239 [Anabarilius grahami]|uniref:Uncharacterized protein n=1 Tax=Anabarilius grahami TaxID=495550 RepID=A0A3N0XNR2_ANAGA|nr:hypothetical protein DPX16_22239 [Anabarilius grahami]